MGAMARQPVDRHHPGFAGRGAGPDRQIGVTMGTGLLRFCWARWALAAAAATLTAGLVLPAAGAAAGTAAARTPGQPNTFVPTGQMATGRSGQTATLLPDGKVLVAGGGSATAELYNPATGTFSKTGNMPVDVTDATGTLLP